MTAETARPTQRAVLEQIEADRHALEVISSVVHELRAPLATLLLPAAPTVIVDVLSVAD